MSTGFYSSSKKPFVAAIVVLSLLVIGLIVAVIILALPKEEKQHITETNYCFKSHCLKAASEILESINSSVDPCNDFYEHSCGTWLTNEKIPPDQDSVGVFRNVRHVIERRLTDLLQEDPAKDEAVAVKKAKIFFRSCMDLKSIEEKSVDVIKKSILLMKNVSNPVELVTLMMNYSANPLVPAFVSSDSKNVSRNIIIVSKTPLMLGTPIYYSRTGKVYTAFRNMIAGFSDILMGNYTNDIIALEWKFKEIYPEASDNASSIYNLMTIEHLDNLTKGQVKWMEIFERAINNSGSKSQINESTIVLVQYPQYIAELAAILNNTHLDTLISFAAANYILKNIDAMPAKYQDLYYALKNAKLSTTVSPSREIVCAKYVRDLMPNAISRIYVDHYFSASSKELAVKLVLTLRAALEQMFRGTKWMDEETRLAAIEKVKSVLPFIGYDDSIKDDEILNKHYQDVNFTKNEFMLNVIKVDHLSGKYLFRGLDSINNRSSWIGVSAAIVNAFYMPSQNAIFFPAGILQAPFYDAQYPLSMLFGAMGAVVGHEFTHGFDNHGAQYDKIGNLKNWWTPQSMENFNARAAGLKKQYAEFPICKNVPDCHIKINENQTIGENIADTGGVKASFKAYKDYVEKNKVEQMVLPGLSYTSDQLFFVGFAHIWCRKIKPNALINQLLTDPHSPEIARVVVTLRNTEAFAKAFKCKENSPMNPKKKYGVW